jgi:hypothetical protein
VPLMTPTAMTNDSERPGQSLYLPVLGLRTGIVRQQEGGMLSSGIGADVNAAVDQANRHLLAAEEAQHTAMVATPEDRGNSSAGHMVLKPGGRVRTQSAAAPMSASWSGWPGGPQRPPPPRRSRTLYEVVRAFYDAVKFTAVTVPGERDFLAPVSDAALGYRNKTSEL